MSPISDQKSLRLDGLHAAKHFLGIAELLGAIGVVLAMVMCILP